MSLPSVPLAPQHPTCRKTVPHHFGFAQHLQVEENQGTKTWVDLLSGIFNRAGSFPPRCPKWCHTSVLSSPEIRAKKPDSRICRGYPNCWATFGKPWIAYGLFWHPSISFFRVLYSILCNTKITDQTNNSWGTRNKRRKHTLVIYHRMSSGLVDFTHYKWTFSSSKVHWGCCTPQSLDTDKNDHKAWSWSLGFHQ